VEFILKNKEQRSIRVDVDRMLLPVDEKSVFHAAVHFTLVDQVRRAPR
jgi:hypothetical protein